MTSKYKKFVINQITNEIDLLMANYQNYQDNKDQDSIEGIFECIENLIPYQELWFPYELVEDNEE